MQKGKMGPNLGIGREGIDRYREESAPEDLEREMIPIDHRIQDIEAIFGSSGLASLETSRGVGKPYTETGE